MSIVFAARSPGEPKWIRIRIISSVHLIFSLHLMFICPTISYQTEIAKWGCSLWRKYWHKDVQHRRLLFLFVFSHSYLSNIDFFFPENPFNLPTYFYPSSCGLVFHQLPNTTAVNMALWLMCCFSSSLCSKISRWARVKQEEMSHLDRSDILSLWSVVEVLLLLTQCCLHCVFNPVSANVFLHANKVT